MLIGDEVMAPSVLSSEAVMVAPREDVLTEPADEKLPRPLENDCWNRVVWAWAPRAHTVRHEADITRPNCRFTADQLNCMAVSFVVFCTGNGDATTRFSCLPNGCTAVHF